MGSSTSRGRHEDDEAAQMLRDDVKHAVQSGIGFLQDERSRDPHRGLTRRLLSRASDSA